MVNKIIGFLDANAEKLLWAAVIILSAAVLFLRVLLSPNYIEYDGKKFSTGSLDEHILKQAMSIEAKLDRKPELSLPYDPCFVSIAQLFETPIQIRKVSVPVPPLIKGHPTPPFIYSLPQIGPVTDVKVNYIRSAAWVPKEEIT
ncbi:MAG: hypothetical protein E4H16_01970 [Candidatus Atribacteria bacterium]|nr:MAG: hypothetical protein E4H16_01970 [Candidatus Atribacteria bacterium]